MTVSTFETVSVLLPAEDRARLSLPAPRLIVPAASAVAERDDVVLRAAGDGLDVGHGQRVGAADDRVSASVPAPRSIDAGVSAAPRVIVSAPVPPVIVSTLATVTLLVPLTRVSAVGAGAEVDRAG